MKVGGGVVLFGMDSYVRSAQKKCTGTRGLKGRVVTWKNAREVTLSRRGSRHPSCNMELGN